jgi:pre-mRNA-splicing factor ATP-dependent RNA helicase DHX16
VRIQWDPERNFHLQPLEYRSIQIGLSGPAVKRYVSEWIVKVRDITGFCKEIEQLVAAGKLDVAKERVPREKIYPLAEVISKRIGASIQSAEACGRTIETTTPA